MKLISKLLKSDSMKVKGALLIVATVFANFFNLVYNAYLGRAISIEDFALISALGGMLGLADLPINALGRSVTHKSAFLLGKYKKPVNSFLLHIRKRATVVSLAITTIWLISIPMLRNFFQTDSALPFLAISPIWILGILSAVDGGYIKGNLKFGHLAAIGIVDSFIRLFTVFVLAQTGNGHYVYIALPVSALVTFLLVRVFAQKLSNEHASTTDVTSNSFPYKFFIASALTRASATIYLTFDILLAKHFLPVEQAGQYALLSLTGKMVYFAGSLFSQFILPIVSHGEGAGKDSNHTFLKLLLGTFISSFTAFIIIGLLGFITMPIIFGSNVDSILPLIPWYAAAMVAFTVATNIAAYHQIKGQHILPAISFLLAILQVILIALFHSNVFDIAIVMIGLGFTSLFIIGITHILYGRFVAIYNNLKDFLDIFSSNKFDTSLKGLNILIYNWRDSRHVWAGGAEVYVEELAKRWVKQGNSVTIFCGNDGKSRRNEKLNGINIVRRGGFFTVYIWAAIYYLIKFRNRYDVIVDSENGIPFFSPLFSTKPVILLIHHVHQEIFLEQLKFPLSHIAKFTEGKIMPFLYRNRQVITVSDSSKNEIIKANIASESNIRIINPGIDMPISRVAKTKTPTFIYLGRLKPYKNVDVAIKSFSKLVKNYPKATLSIVGEGESLTPLRNLTNKLNLGKQVTFWGKVSNKKKVKLLSQSWVALQPSSVEGWGITVLEANACGTPVIASDVNGLKDSILDSRTGLLVPLKSVNALSNAMEHMLLNEKKRKILTKNALVWSKQFSWETSSNIFLASLEREIKKAQKPTLRPAFNIKVFNRN